MVKVDGPVQYNHITKTALASLFSDTKEEVGANMTVVGLMDGYTLEAGSSVFTASKELGMLKSDNTWIW